VFSALVLSALVLSALVLSALPLAAPPCFQSFTSIFLNLLPARALPSALPTTPYHKVTAFSAEKTTVSVSGS